MKFGANQKFLLLRVILASLVIIPMTCLPRPVAKAGDKLRYIPTPDLLPYRVEDLWKNWLSMSTEEFCRHFYYSSSQLLEADAFKFIRHFFDSKRAFLTPAELILLLQVAQNPIQEEWLIDQSLHSHPVGPDGILIRSPAISIELASQIVRSVSEPLVRKKLLFLFARYNDLEQSLLEGSDFPITFKIGDFISLSSKSPVLKLAAIFPDGTGMTEEGVLLGPLDNYKNLSKPTRLFNQILNLSLIPAWNQISELPRIGFNPKAKRLSDSMKLLIDLTQPIQFKKDLIAALLVEFPEVPVNIRREMAKIIGIDLKSLPPTDKAAYQQLFFKRKLPELKEFTLKSVLKPIEDYFGARLDNLPVHKARKLRQIIQRLKEGPNVIPLGKGGILVQSGAADPSFLRYHLDEIAKELILNYPELSPEIKQNLLSLFIEVSPQDIERANLPAVLGPDSLIDTRQVLDLRQKGILLASLLGFPDSSKANLNVRQKELNRLKGILMAQFPDIDPSYPIDALQTNTLYALETTAAKILSQFGDLPPNVKEVALAMLRNPTDEQRRIAQESQPADPINPLQFTPAMLRAQNSVNSEIKQMIFKTQKLELINEEMRSRSLDFLISWMSEILTGPPEQLDSTLGVKTSDLPVLDRYSRMAEYLIGKFPDLPKKTRQSLLSLVPNPSAEIIGAANANPQRHKNSGTFSRDSSHFGISATLLDELGPEGLLDNRLFAHASTLWPKSMKNLPKIPVLWLGSATLGSSQYVTRAADVVGTWNPRASFDIHEVPNKFLDLSYFGSEWDESIKKERNSLSRPEIKSAQNRGRFLYPIELRTQAQSEPDKAESLRLNYVLDQLPESCVKSLRSITFEIIP